MADINRFYSDPKKPEIMTNVNQTTGARVLFDRILETDYDLDPSNLRKIPIRILREALSKTDKMFDSEMMRTVSRLELREVYRLAAARVSRSGIITFDF